MLWSPRLPGAAAARVASCALAVSSLVLPGDVPLPARFTAFAVDPFSGSSIALDVNITRWSTPADAEALSSTFNERGMDALQRALQKTPRAGSLRLGTSLGDDVRFVQRSSDRDGRQRLLVIADRRIGDYEITTLAPSMAYPLTVVDMQIDAHGAGSGTLWPVARIGYWDLATQTIVIDNYTWQPLNLMGVRWRSASTH